MRRCLLMAVLARTAAVYHEAEQNKWESGLSLGLIRVRPAATSSIISVTNITASNPGMMMSVHGSGAEVIGTP
jgi:hypothetical protein